MWWRVIKVLSVAAICGTSIIGASAQNVVKVAAAANLRYVMSEIEQLYEADTEGVDIQINYGASGMFYQQITNGAPFDLFLSADDILPTKLKESGVTAAESQIYACGKLALYGLRDDIEELGLEVLSQSEGRIAIANPRTAPYGTRSVEILRARGVWSEVERRVAYGDSIAQAAQFALTGNCEVGFVALSLLLNPEVELKGSTYVIPEEMYKPIAQAGIVLRDGGARALFEYMLSEKCRAVWNKYGYSLAK